MLGQDSEFRAVGRFESVGLGGGLSSSIEGFLKKIFLLFLTKSRGGGITPLTPSSDGPE